VKVRGKNKNQGRHTTTIATLWSLDNGGAVIDTPGIRSFGLAQLPAQELALFFPEMVPYVGYCKFSDCRHDDEPSCAIRKAVVTGEINPLRYKNYIRLAEELQ
jgi:ribosome biogenesis GTPase